MFLKRAKQEIHKGFLCLCLGRCVGGGRGVSVIIPSIHQSRQEPPSPLPTQSDTINASHRYSGSISRRVKQTVRKWKRPIKIVGLLTRAVLSRRIKYICAVSKLLKTFTIKLAFIIQFCFCFKDLYKNIDICHHLEFLD